MLFYYTAKDENTIDAIPSNPAVTVNVTGFQWSWEFNYPQYGVNTDGNMWNPDLTDAQNQAACRCLRSRWASRLTSTSPRRT